MKYREIYTALLEKDTINSINMAQINILKSNQYKEKLNASHRLDQYPLDMVVLYIKSGNLEEFTLEFQWKDMILSGITITPLEYVLR